MTREKRMTFFKRLEQLQEKNNSLVSIALDFDLEKSPKSIEQEDDPIFFFCKSIIDSTQDLVCCYKLNIPFFEAIGFDALKSLKEIVNYIHSLEIPVILDSKRNDIGNTAKKYAQSIFDFYGADSMTINPYMGEDSITPFLDYKDKGVFILARTSNPGGKDFQDLIADGIPVYQHVIKRCLELDENKNMGFVIGATNPTELKEARSLAPDSVFLIPGIGAQGGEIKSTVENGIRQDKKGIIIVSGRSVIFASGGEDFAEASRNETIKLRDEINKYR